MRWLRGEISWPSIRSQLLAGTYQPQPVKRVEIPKPDGGVRKLGVPCVVDRLIQQALLQVLQEQWDPCFGRFRLDSARRELRCDNEPVQLGGRALDILCVLASAEGTLVSKDELMARVWGGDRRGEQPSGSHLGAAKALEDEKTGERWIITVPGRGYLLRRSHDLHAADSPVPTPSLPRYCGQTGTLRAQPI
jgi:DNA-binding winged helix-turn-helix (wHTH) protein